MMRRGVRCVFCRSYRSEIYPPGSSFHGGIDKENGICKGNVFGQVGSPLLARDHANARVRLKTFRGPFSEPRTNAIVGAQCIAAGKNQAACTTGVSQSGSSG